MTEPLARYDAKEGADPLWDGITHEGYQPGDAKGRS